MVDASYLLPEVYRKGVYPVRRNVAFILVGGRFATRINKTARDKISHRESIRLNGLHHNGIQRFFDNNVREVFTRTLHFH
jgi:hypothetical protein